jgi:Uma2 family endonuclease
MRSVWYGGGEDRRAGTVPARPATRRWGIVAVILTMTKPVTDEDLLELSRLNPGYQFERDARGELIVTPTGSEGGGREAELGRQLGNWAEQDGRGRAFSSSAGFRLDDGAVYAPDASWVRRDAWEAIPRDQRKKFAPLCPDAVFEIRSESQSPAELRDKMRTYLANGARLAVLIDPEARTVEVSRPGQKTEMHTRPETVGLDPELPGFVLDLRRIFEV